MRPANLTAERGADGGSGGRGRAYGAADARRVRLLVVDDQEDDALLLVDELRRAGYEVAFARVDTAEGLRAALEGRWDVVLSDWSMPHFSGVDALRIVRERNGGLPFILVSGTIGEERAVEAMRGGAHDVILKGRLARLAPAVRRELRDAAARAELRLAEERLRESEAALARAEKLRLLGQMAAGISHDLCNLLNPVSLYAQAALRAHGRGDGAGAAAALVEVQHLLTRCLQTIERLRDYGRGEPAGRLEPLDVNALVVEGVDVARARLTSRRRVAIVTALGDPPPALGVANEVVNAVVNLVVNAIDAIQTKGEGVVVSTRAADGGACIEVADDGPGMGPEVERHAFEPFFTTKGAEGSGLGLATVYASLRRYGGDVRLETEPGEGTTVRLWLPRVAT